MLLIVRLHSTNYTKMPFVTTAIHATSLHDDEKITFREYENCDTSKKYVKVTYISDNEEFNNVFNDTNPMPEYLAKIYDYTKKSSCVNYIEDDHLYVLMGSHLFKNGDKRTALMVSDKNIIGEVTDRIHIDATDALSQDAQALYEDAYGWMMKCKYNITV